MGTGHSPVFLSKETPVSISLPVTSAQSTAFGEMRVASPYALFDATFKYQIDPLEWGTAVEGSGAVTHLANESSAKLAVTSASGDRARLRTSSFHRYQAGKSQHVRLTIVNSDTGQTNQVRRWGYFDDNDGLFFELSGTTLRVVRRTSTSGISVDSAVAQSAWNVDPMDGSGPSGESLDITKGSIFEVDFQWLGVGNVRWTINGHLVHMDHNANTFAYPYIKTAVLPVQYEVINSGASSAGYVKAICASVMSEGGHEPPEYCFGVYNPADISVGTSERPILSIRVAALLNSITYRGLVIPRKLVISTETQRAGYRMVLNGTLTNASFAAADSNSGVEYDYAATAISGGSTLFRGMVPAGDAREVYLSEQFHHLARVMRRNAFNTDGDVLTITAINESTGSTNMRASINWEEIR